MGLTDGRDIGRARTRTRAPVVRRTPVGTRASGSREPLVSARAPVARAPGTRASGAREPRVGAPTSAGAPRAASPSEGTGRFVSTGGGSGGGTGAGAGSGGGGADDAKDQEVRDKVAADADATLQSQLDAIAAQYGLTREQLDAEGGEIGRQWRMAKAQLMRSAREAQAASLDDMVARGILRSGITVEERIELERQEELGANTLDVDRQVSLADIASRRAALDPQQKAEEAAATAQHEAQLRDLELMKAAYGQA